MSDNQDFSQRRFFRLQYPVGERLSVWLQGGGQFFVDEISESSLRFTEAYLPNDRKICKGFIEWSDGTVTEFIGIVGPRRGNKRVLVDVQGIPFQRVVSEQRRLIRKYPLLKSDIQRF